MIFFRFFEKLVKSQQNSPRHIEDKLHHDHFHACMKYVAAIVCNTEKNKCICNQLNSKILPFTKYLMPNADSDRLRFEIKTSENSLI